MTVPNRTMPTACFHVLLALADAPRHGLGIVEEVERRTDARVTLGPGSLYGSLKRLTEDGWIQACTDRPVENDDTRRRYYEITPEGRRALRDELEILDAVLESARQKSLLTRRVR